MLSFSIGIVVVIKMEGQPFICKTDEVGEICVHSSATGNQYWGLQGLTNNTFKVSPLQADGSPLGDVEYTRSGLLGFLGPGGLVFVCGSRDGLMTVTGRKHNADDIIATVLAVEPMKFIYRGRIAVFSVRVLRDERICVVAEQRPDCSEEEVCFFFFFFFTKFIILHLLFSICIYIKLILTEFPMDVSCPPSGRFHSRGWNILFGTGPAKLPPENAARRHSSVGNETTFLRGYPTSG